MPTDAQRSTTAVFHCKPIDASPLTQGMIFILVGAFVGAVGWFEVDRTVSFAHLAGWIGGCVIVFAPLAWLVSRNPVRSISVDDTGLAIDRPRRPLRFAWDQIEAARFQEYEAPHSPDGKPLRCFLLRAGGESFELTPEFDDEQAREAFEEAMFRELEFRDIPESSKGLPSFERILSQSGAWLFAASIAGLLVAHALGYHTFGTIFGVAFLLTGSVLAFMTRRERTSRLVLTATLVLIVGSSAILRACKVNVRETLLRWEWSERTR